LIGLHINLITALFRFMHCTLDADEMEVTNYNGKSS